MKSLRSTLAPRYSVAFILLLSCLMILMASALSVSPSSSLGSSSLASSARADATAATTAGEAVMLASPPLLPGGAPNITATKTASPAGPVNPGDTITYTVVISNTTGTADATAVNFADTIDPNTTFVAGSILVSPIAVNDTYNTIGNVNISVAAAQGLLANDLNPGGMGTLGFTLINATPFVSGTAVATTHGSVTVNTDGSFTYNPTAGFSGPSDSFSYTLGNGTGKTDTATVTINISGLIWFVDNSPGPNGDGRLSSPFRTLVGGANPLTGTVANDVIFIYTGSGNYTGGLTLTSGEKFIGQGAGDTLLNITGFTAPSGTNLLPATGGSNPVITAAVNNITLGTGNTIRGVTLNVTAVGATAITGSGFGTLTLAETAIGGTNGRALNLTTGTLSGPVASTAAFTSISSTNSSATGISLTSVGGIMSSGSTTITTPTGIGISVNTSSAALSFNNTTSVTNSGGTAVSLTTNTGTIAFATLNITNTTSNQAGLVATDNTNTITTTSGTINTGSGTAVNISKSSGTTPLNITLTSVSASGGTNDGIALSNTSGSFAVLGDGVNTTVGGNNTGGTISNKSGSDGSTANGIGIYLNNATNVTLRRIHVTGTNQNFGVFGTSVTGFVMEYSTVDGSNGTNNATPFNEGSVTFLGLFGTCTFTSDIIKGGFQRNVNITNSSGTANLTVTGSTIRDTNTGVSGDDNLFIQADTTATVTAHVTGNTFAACNGDHMQVNTLNGATMTIVFTGNFYSGGGGVNALGEGITISGGNAGSSEHVNFNISNNGSMATPLTGNIGGGALNINQGSGGGTWQGQVSGNWIGDPAVANSGSTSSSGIRVENHSVSGTMTAIVDSNHVRQWNSGPAINHQVGDTGNVNAALNLTDTNNVITNPGTNSQHGIVGNFGADTAGTNAVCVDIRTNNIDLGAVPPNGGANIRLRQRNGSTVRLPGYVGKTDGTDNAPGTGVIGFESGQNTLNPAGNVTFSVQAPGGGFVGGAACTQPVVPTSVQPGDVQAASTARTDATPDDLGQFDSDLRVAHGEAPKDDSIPKLTQAELNWMVQAAVARWIETKISAEDLARLQAATFEVSDLSDSHIASAVAGHIKIDETAAGYGWYLDQFPNEDSEFDVPVPDKEFQTTQYSPAHGKMDLLTVLMRELGAVYLQGKDRVPKQLRPLMEPTLSPSVRRLPDPSLVQLTPPQSDVQSAPQAAPSESAASSPAVGSSSGGNRAVHTSSKISPQTTGFPLSLGTIPQGESVTIMFQVTVNALNTLPVGTSQVCNQGTVSGSNFSNVLTDDPSVGGAADPTCTPLNVADLSVTKSAGSSPVCSTGNITFTINYNNAGPAAAVNAVVSDALPAGTSLVSVTTPATWSRTDSVPVGGIGTITFSKASSPNADAATFTIVVSIDASVADGAVIQNTASVSSNTPDTNPANNTSAATSTTVKKPPTTATVGGAQSICALGTTASLGGNTPTIGTGTWTVQSGGTGTFNPNATTPGATFTHATGTGPIVLRWTISNPPCADSFAEVTVTVKAQPTATAGGPQTICALGTTASLGGNTPSGGATGTWSIVTGGVTGTFNPNANTPGATFTHTSGGIGSTITLRWTVSNPPCPDATADVAITIKSQPTATAGGPQTICAGGTTAGLGGNTPAAGQTGTWSIVTAGVVGTFNPNANTPNATFTHTSGAGPFTLRWTVSNPPCTNATADVVITLLPAPVATTGGPQTICAGGTTASLGGNTPAAGETGTWSIVTAGVTGTFNPNANTPGATFTHISGGVGGTITLRWTVTNPTCGGSATADAIITVNQQQTATAGGPQTICAGSTTTGLGGNTPSSGTGTWTIVTGGATGTFNPNANTPNATFTPTSGAGTITLRWTISSPPCADSFAEVIITVKQQPTATAGGPQTICAGGTTAGLGGNTPTGGATGMWTIVTAGAAGTFNPNASTPNATFTHTGGTGTITLRWTVSNPPCPNATADVAISITQPPTTATVGPNQTIAPGGTTAPLGGNTPSSGTGMWSIVTAGATGTFNPNASTPNATWTHATGSGQVVLRWTISNPPCPSSQADVTIQIGTPPTITCPVSPVVANTAPGQCSATVTFNVTATGVPTPTVTCTPPSGSVFQKGNTTVNCTAANGVQPDATCSFTVTVNDMQPPSITCPANITQSTDPNLCTAVVSYVTPTASDNCPCGAAPVKNKPTVASCAVVCAPASGATFPKGTTTVTCTATDASGNQASCSFTVTVNDTQPPSITCPASISGSTDPNLCTAVVTYNAPVVSDNCPGVGTPVCNPASGSTFPKGTTTVTCNVADASGNQSSCSFTVTVNDTQPPSITCPANITTKTPQAGDPCVIVNYPPPVVTDNCPGATVVCTPPSGSCFPLGTTTVTCTATDTSGNTATCTFKVNVFDLCVQDDSDPTTVVLINSLTGDYRFCCHGVTYTGRGTMTIRGSTYTLEHNPSDRRVLVKDDEGVHKATGSIQAPPGTTRCTITDRNTLDNSCVCQ